MKFESLYAGKASDNEQKMIQYWDRIDLLQKSIDERDPENSFVFYEGPPTANGKPGIHHVLARTLKDSVCRYKTMQGYQVKRKAGWDTHGLPVEIEVEKKLGLHNKQEIEAYGVEAFNKQCRESVFEYESLWRNMTTRMGYLINMDDPYITLDNNYIESVWWILNRFYEEGLIYEGHKILPYCSRCGTGLATHEVAQGYRSIKSNTITVKFQRKGKENEYFLAWTTTPWTLPSNVALTVSPTELYVRAKQGDEIYILAKTLAPAVLKEEYEILEEFPGSALEYEEYEQLLPYIPADKKAFFVILGDFVTTEDGTGIVHTAPAFGEDDYQVGRKYDLPVLKPVGEDGKFIGTPWSGHFVMEDGLDVEILKTLASENKIYDKQKMEHNYPHCWRCDTPLMYYANPSYYIEMTKLKDQMVQNNATVNWYPDYIGEKRFGNWLENINDWAISRSRYWGTPLNIWTCECGHKESIGSIEELRKKAIKEVDASIELHRPYVDEIHLRCPKCNEAMSRVPDVIDVWFDSGSMPYAQLHYPFENKELFETNFPADFINEGIDQTRGWFYSLMAISTFIKGASPYKNVLVNDLLLDKNGKKMSKSKGNTVDPFEIFDQYGADALRWYLLSVSPAWLPTRFDIEGVKETQSRFFGTLKNVYHFFALYANLEPFSAEAYAIPFEERAELDRWILSKYNRLIQTVENEMNVYDMTKVTRALQDFVSEDLSNWYIRRSRRRFWDSELTEDKKSVFITTYEILIGISQLMAPYAPFLADEIYQKLTGNETVHTSYTPVCNPDHLDDALEEKMFVVKELVRLGRASRESERIKVRQPLSRAYIDKKYELLIQDLVPLILEELNLKEVVFSDDLNEYLSYTLKPNFPVLGKILGPKMKAFTKVVSSLNAKDSIAKLNENGSFEVDLDGERFEVQSDYLLTNIEAKDGYDVSTSQNLYIILDTHLSTELIQEGNAREFVSKIQQMRKSNDYEMMDRIAVSYQTTPEMKESLTAFDQYVKEETLAVSLQERKVEEMQIVDLNGQKTSIHIELA